MYGVCKQASKSSHHFNEMWVYKRLMACKNMFTAQHACTYGNSVQ